MARTLITNISGAALTLPAPYNGALQNGASTVVGDAAATVIGYLGGGDAIRNVWQVDEVSDGNPVGPFSSANGAIGVIAALGAATVPISVNGQRITNLGTPTQNSDAATKLYVDTHAGPGGGVQGVTGTSPIVVDNTDPANPIVELNQALLSIDDSQVTGLGTAALVNVPVSGDASSTEAVLGNDTRIAALSPDPSGSYTNANVTVDGQGRVTAASNGVGASSAYDINIQQPGFLANGELLAVFPVVRDFTLASPATWRGRLTLAPTSGDLNLLVTSDTLGNLAQITFLNGSVSISGFISYATFPRTILAGDRLTISVVGSAGAAAGLSLTLAASAAVTATAPYDFQSFKSGLVASGEVLARWIMDRSGSIEDLSTYARGYAGTPPSGGGVVFEITKNGSVVGTMTFADGAATPTFAETVAFPLAFSPDDIIGLGHGGGATYSIGAVAFAAKGAA